MPTLDDPNSSSHVRFHWEVACLHYGITVDFEEIISDIVSKYSEPHRAYHNSTHVAKMIHRLNYLDYFFPTLNLDDSYELNLAAIFHDVIYDPQAKDNEELSAEYATHALGLLDINQSSISNVTAYILCTKTHQIDPSLPFSAAMIDADLAVLSAEQEEYEAYAKAIRFEYGFVNDDDYRIGRTKVLESFLKRESIYLVAGYREEYESIARENLSREIAELNKQ